MLPNGDWVICTPRAPERARAALRLLLQARARRQAEHEAAAASAVMEARACWIVARPELGERPHYHRPR